jgi:hypothetical protein
LQANVNAAATATRSLVTLGFWAEPWEVWSVADEDRPYYEGGFLAARVGWELLPTYGVGKLTQVPGQMGRWGRYALRWDTAQNAVQVGRGGYDIYENGPTWANGLQVGTGLLGLGGNYTTWQRLPGSITATSRLGTLRWIGPNAWESSGGLRYVGKDRYDLNRVQHLLKHTRDDPTRSVHGVFDTGKSETLAVVDEAWIIAQRGGHSVTVVQEGNRTVYIIDMGRRIGYIGGKKGAANGFPSANHIKLVIEANNQVVTAYPFIP